MKKRSFDFRASWVAIALIGLSACEPGQTPPSPETSAKASETPRSIAAKVLQAHGGRDAWNALQTIYIAREHHLSGQPRAWDYAIYADYKTERLYMDWNYPAGLLVWDGERAWSVDWGPAEFILPRFAMGIGFFAINLPYFMNSVDADLVSLEKRIGQAPGDDKEYWVLGVEFEGQSARKPVKVATPRDLTEVYIDPETFLIAGTHFNWSYAEQLDIRGQGETAFFQNYVVEDYVEHRGIKWPSHYVIYDREGNITTRGRYFDYAFDIPLDETMFIAGENAKFDNSSSYQRRATGGTESE